MNRKFLIHSCLMTLLMIAWFLSCAREQGITIVYDAYPLNMDPHLRKEIVVTSILANIYEPLVSFNADMKITAQLCEYWEKVDDLTWRFTLRKGVKFHCGRALSASDVIFSLYRALRMSESEYKAYGEYLDTILVEGESGIIIRLKNQYAFLLYDLAGVLIVHQGFDERTLEFCGTGPYRFVTRSDDHLDLEYFADYWGEEPAIKRARYLFIPDYTDRMRALARREADIITYLPLTELDECRKAGRIVANQGVSTRYLQMDLTEFPYGNEYFRRAVNLSIDRERLCREVYQGYAVPANQFLPPGVFGFDHALGQFPYAPDSAKKLLSMLGALPVIEFDYSVARSAIADRIADDLTQVGLKLKKNALEANDYWAKVDTRQTDLVLIASIPSSYEGVGTLRSSFHTKRPEQRTGLLNRTGYSSRRLDSLIEMLTLAPDQGTATGMMIEAQKILLDDLPKIPVVWEKEIYAVSDRIDWEPRLDEMIIIKEITLRK